MQHNKQSLLVTIPCFPLVSFPQPDLLCSYVPYSHLIKRNNGFREETPQPIHCQHHRIPESKVHTKTGAFRKKVQCRMHLLGPRCQRSSHTPTLWEKDEASVA